MRPLKTIQIASILMIISITGCQGDDIGTDGPDPSTLDDPGLSWSASSYEATIGGNNSFPVLTNPYDVSVTYTSSDATVASITPDGTITLLSAGTTSITASSASTDKYSASSVSYTLRVNKSSTGISWSASAWTVKKDGSGNNFPTLSNPGGQNISYSSSNEKVATISGNGDITLVAEGETTITATAAANDTYQAATASYTLVVTSGADEGTGSYTFSSTGDPSSDDDIANTTFTRKIIVRFSSGGATVTGDYYGYASVNGNNVTVNNTGDEFIVYELTGTASSGSFKLYSTRKQAILLNGVSITNPDGAAIDNQSGKRTFVMVEGSNTLADGPSAAYSTSNDEDMKAVFFSEGQLVFSGSGSLEVNAGNKQEKGCITSDDYVRVMDSPTLKLTSSSSAGHGLKGKDYVQLSSGNLVVSVAAAKEKGITSEDYVLVQGGNHSITVTGGVAYDSEDAEYKGTAGIKADNYFGMTGGSVTIKNTGTGGKGVHAGSYDFDEKTHAVADSYISGGTLSITTTGKESNDVSTKGIKIGWVTKSGSGQWARITGSAGNLTINGGSVIVNAANAEGIECKGVLTISGGETYVTSSGDDAINSLGEMDITGGYVYACSSKNDAMDANGDLKISGGYVMAICTKGAPEVALDANTEEGHKLYIQNGATVVAYGGLESGYSSSQSIKTMSCTAGSWNALHNGSSFIAAFKLPSGISSVAVTAPSLSGGYKSVSVGNSTFCNGVWATSSISGGSSVSLGNYTGSGGGPGGPGHH